MRNIMPSQPNFILVNVAQNLRRLRLAAGMSQDELAKKADLSRRMVNGVEAGSTNISLVNLDHLAAALKVTFADLVRDVDAKNDEVKELIWQGNSPESRAELLGAAPASRSVELWKWSLAPGERYDPLPDAQGFHEMIVVTVGQLTILFAEQKKQVGSGDFFIYRSSQAYSYVNEGEETVHFVCNVVS